MLPTKALPTAFALTMLNSTPTVLALAESAEIIVVPSTACAPMVWVFN